MGKEGEVSVATDDIFDVLNRDQRTAITIDRSSPKLKFFRFQNWPCKHRPQSVSLLSESCDKCRQRVSDCRHGFPKTSTTSTTSTTSGISGISGISGTSGTRKQRRFHVDSFRISESISSNCRNLESATTERRVNVRNIINRLGDVFIVGVCLLTIVRAPAAMSAPASRHNSRDEPDDSGPKWMYPCGKDHEQELENEYDLMPSRETDVEILKHIIVQAQIALSYAESFKNEYVQKTFDLPFDKHHDIWIQNSYDWLPSTENEIPKKLGKSVKAGHLESKGFDEFLKKIYEYLQKFAVGIEQIVWDQAKSHGEFQQHFNMTEVHLRQVLCEIRTAMIERNIGPNSNVERSIMGDQYRNMETVSYRNLRDWLIFRDYMNGLEYVIEVFKYIQKNLPS